MFAGTFQSDIATVNNIPAYFDNDTFEPRFQRRMNLPDVNGLWNPRGPGALLLSDVRLTGACYADGRLLTGRGDDPVLEGRLVDDDRRAHGKFVDLDPTNQMVPEIYGFRPRLLDASGAEQLRSEFLPAAMEDPWPRAFLPSGRPDIAATYQSVLSNIEWAEKLTSPLLRRLREASDDGLLSIKFTVDGVEDGVESWPDNLTYGRIVGAIGPYLKGEPKRFVAGRRLRQQPGGSLNHAPCVVNPNDGLVTVDLGNSIPARGRGGPLVDVGPLRLAVLDDAGRPTVLAPLDGMEGDYYTQRAAILTARMDPVALTRLTEARLAVVNAAEPPAVLLAESADGLWVHADGFVIRLEPGANPATAATTIHATRFGRPAAGVTVYLTPDPVTPAVSAPSRVSTGDDGWVDVTFTGHDPGNPRGWIDGATAQLPYGVPERPNEPEGTFNVRVFDRYSPPAWPTWARDVRPIFQQYANLFPVMRDVLDLASYDDVLRHRVYIRRTLLASRDSPNHMPITRDLSSGKRDMIVNWLDTKPQPPILDIRTVADLREALLQAMLVEQAVMPPYLAALFSIKAGRNQAIADLIRGVVLEEMQHMAQVCNVLNAVGGTPRIGRPGLVPTYPGKLPGPVLPDLEVRLRKLTLEHVKNVFMVIEEPQHPTVDGKTFRGAVINRNDVRLDRTGRIVGAEASVLPTLEGWFAKAEYQPQTIGWFYNQIARAIIRLDAAGKIFTGDPGRQVAWPDAPTTLYRVNDKRSALLGIYQIIEQGEGSPHDLNGDSVAEPAELGHYYRFEEIVRGRQLVRNQGGQWVFEGAEIPFDPEGVYPMMDDPDTYRLDPSSVARRESIRCDDSYTSMLTSLNRVFNGHPEELDDAVGLMLQLQVQAKKLLTMPTADGASTVLGPAFISPGVSI